MGAYLQRLNELGIEHSCYFQCFRIVGISFRESRTCPALGQLRNTATQHPTNITIRVSSCSSVWFCYAFQASASKENSFRLLSTLHVPCPKGTSDTPSLFGCGMLVHGNLLPRFPSCRHFWFASENTDWVPFVALEIPKGASLEKLPGCKLGRHRGHPALGAGVRSPRAPMVHYHPALGEELGMGCRLHEEHLALVGFSQSCLLAYSTKQNNT